MFNNIIASSALATSRINEFNFTQSYGDYITMPRSVCLTKCSIPNTMLSFRPDQLCLYISFLGSVYEITIVNGWYDNVSEFVPMLTSAIQEQVSSEFTFSYSTAHECLKLTNTSNHPFSILPASYSSRSLAARLGFIESVAYSSFPEGSNAVVYASGILKLARTSGFYIVSSLVSPTNFTACSNGTNDIVDFIPIDVQNLNYGDSIVVINPSPQTNRVKLTPNEMYNASSSFSFAILDDEFNAITDPFKNGITTLFFSLDYD